MVDIVTFILETMNLHQTLRHILRPLQRGNDLLELVGHALDHFGKVEPVLGDFLDVENDDCASGVINQVNDVVERRRHHVNVFAIEWSDEGLVQTSRDIMSELVARVLESLDALRILGVIVVLVGQHLLQLARGRGDVERHLREQVEVLMFFGEQANQTHGTPSFVGTLSERMPDYNLPVADLPNVMLVVYQKAGMIQDHLSDIQQLLRIESDAIAQTATRLDEDQVRQVVELLANCKGKVVILGVGKSGIIGQKIAATMTSTGTAALYLHPSDALHGSLGIVQGDDVVMVLSNSGETDELVAMLPSLKNRGVPIVAIVGNLNSTLARRADAVLDASVDKEACPLNLAPTTSTTVALAIGDALAMTVMKVKGLTSDDFAVNHPAGRLGKRLTLRVADLMHCDGENPTIATGSSWVDVVRAISNGGLGAVCVVDDDGRLAGIITDGDLRRAIERTSHDLLAKLTGDDFMTRKPVVATPELLAFDALRLMEDRPRQISVLPVIDQDGKCVGLIRVHDIVRSGL